jgi:DNA-binding NarL/FixJ family response regulator
MYTFVIVDDHPLFRGALKQALSSFSEDVEILEIGDLEGAKRLIPSSANIDLVLLDLSLNGVGGMAGLITLRSLDPLIPIAIVSATDDPATVRAALELGASGFISKSSTPDVIREAVQSILNGEVWSPLADDKSGELSPDLADLVRCIRKLTRSRPGFWI